MLSPRRMHSKSLRSTRTVQPNIPVSSITILPNHVCAHRDHHLRSNRCSRGKTICAAQMDTPAPSPPQPLPYAPILAFTLRERSVLGGSSSAARLLARSVRGWSTSPAGLLAREGRVGRELEGPGTVGDPDPDGSADSLASTSSTGVDGTVGAFLGDATGGLPRTGAPASMRDTAELPEPIKSASDLPSMLGKTKGFPIAPGCAAVGGRDVLRA